MNYCINNDSIRISISENGGSFTSIFDIKRDVELLYQPVSNSWQGQDVFIFPFIARLKDGTYLYKEKEYAFKNHGLIRYMKGEMSTCENKLIATFHSDEDTLNRYPFEFVATSEYELINNEIKVIYRIKNLSNEDMPFMVGGHPAFKIPGELKETEFDISGNKIVFPSSLNLKRVKMNDACTFFQKIIDYKTTGHIDLSKEFIRKENTLILKADDFKYVDLYKKDGSALRIIKNDIKYLAIWSDPYFGDYVAIEPWQGLPDTDNENKDLLKHPEIMILKPKKEYVLTYSIVILN